MTTPFNKRNWFNLDHDHKTTLDMGQLVPLPPIEVMPGDTFVMDQAFFSRLEAMIAPAYADISLFVYNFFVPYRILCEEKDWENFYTGGEQGNSTLVFPYMTAPSGGYAVGSLADHLGIKPGVGGFKHSAMPFRAYAKIFNEWFRNQNFVSELALSTAMGADTTTNTTLQNKMWEKDYFTGALPWTQRGSVATIPGGEVVGNGMALGLTDGTNLAGTYENTNNAYSSSTNLYGATVGTTQTTSGVFASGKAIGVTTDPSKSGLTTSPITINALRWAFQVQKFLETQGRSGARMVETVLSHFGVRIPDSRLQRSELIGAARMRVMISPVEQTSSTDATTPQGNLAGRGTLNQGMRRVKHSFCEPGLIMTLVSFLPRTEYAQGLNRLWFHEDRYDFPWPVFSHTGEQEVMKGELMITSSDTTNREVFGYNDRYAEYRHIPSTSSGLMRPDQSLGFWTLTRQFASMPALNSNFVTSDPSKRIFAVTLQSVPCITLFYKNRCRALRPLPKYGYPGLIDHM